MGTPLFAATFLEHLAQTEHKIVGVVTKPDQGMGRGRKIKASPVKETALELSLPVLRPESLKDSEFLSSLKALEADVFVVVAFSLLPKVVLECARQGAINVHGSMLPKYRGAAPVQWAIADGLTKTGVSVFLLDEKMDTGPLLVQKTVPIGANHTTVDVLNAMIPIGCAALDEALEKLNSGFEALPQNHDLATSARKLSREDAIIDWSLSAVEIYNRQRAFYPWPGSYSYLDAKKVVFHQFVLVNSEKNLAPGQAEVDETGRLLVGTGQGLLEVLNLQLAGRKALSAADFVLGLQGQRSLEFNSQLSHG